MIQPKEEKENLDYIYYIIALVSGMFIGAIIDKGFTWIFVGGILGLLSATLFLNVLAKGRGEEA